jgi:alpha-beta hydrolase superfamily lysophospholipase
MSSNQVLEGNVVRTEELVFAGDGVRLSGQIEYPYTRPTKSLYPLIFVLHHAGCEARDGYQHFADVGLECGYAVFRWDKRGTGKSGAGGRGSTTQDAVNAYEIALEQPKIDRRRVVILAQGAGTALLGSSFGLFARVQHPYGAILATNMLDEASIRAIDTRVQILVGQDDWNPWQKYGKAACDAHNATYQHGASFYVAPFADRTLLDQRSHPPAFHAGVRMMMREWLSDLCSPSR